MSDRLSLLALPALLALTGCATMAKADVAILGTPPEPLEAGKHFVVTGTRAETYARCAKILGFPAHACVYRRAGDSIATVIVSIDDVGPVWKHEMHHVQQDADGEPMDHRGWK